MSLGRIGARAALVAVGVLASVALMAAPSWAKNSTNSKLCEAGGYPGVLFAQDGSTFKNEGKCTSYTAKGGQLAGISIVVEPAVGGNFTVTCSGFGLKPGFPELTCEIHYQEGTENPGSVVAADGTASVSGSFPCRGAGNLGKVTGVEIIATTAAGARIETSAPPPSGC